jgi:hypothetical protein
MMDRIHYFRWILIAFIVISLAACAGRQFVRPSKAILNLGMTTEDEVLAEMGEPHSSKEGHFRGEKVKNVFYGYFVSDGSKTLGRAAVFYFVDKVLVGYYFQSEFAGESTDFDITKAGQIAEKASTREDVIVLLGLPSGAAIYPFTDDRNGRVLWYRYSNTFSKEVDVEIDEDGVVQRVNINIKPKK